MSCNIFCRHRYTGITRHLQRPAGRMGGLVAVTGVVLDAFLRLEVRVLAAVLFAVVDPHCVFSLESKGFAVAPSSRPACATEYTSTITVMGLERRGQRTGGIRAWCDLDECVFAHLRSSSLRHLPSHARRRWMPGLCPVVALSSRDVVDSLLAVPLTWHPGAITDLGRRMPLKGAMAYRLNEKELRKTRHRACSTCMVLNSLPALSPDR
ncbi:hypothetical protein C8F01DRAFT_694634 [Mycena amicta]|nr:hypothetical protein C8F01DRAFT_694634 [Mycena amicta]